MIYHIGICDDEKGTCGELEEYIYRYFENQASSVEVKAWYSGAECCRELAKREYDVDILFLDIEIPKQNGVEIGKYIREELDNNGIHIVYISHKSNYAMELFQVHPYDFLIKPVMQKDINRVLTKLLLLDEQDKRFYTFTYRQVKHKVQFGKIQYVVSCNKHIELHMEDGKIISFTGKLKAEAEKFPNQFAVIGKSFIVNMKYISDCAYDHVMMQNGERINISQPNRALFREKLREFNGGED